MAQQAQNMANVTEQLTRVTAELRTQLNSNFTGDSTDQNQNSQNVTNTANSERALVPYNNQWKAEDIGFFDPHLPQSYGSGPVVRDGKDLYYRNVHLFVERVRDLSKTKGDELIKTNLNTCLRGTALIWYTAELTELERAGLRRLELSEWIDALTKRFRPNRSEATSALLAEKFTLNDVRTQKEPAAYVQRIVSHAKDAGFETTAQQLRWAWDHLDPELRDVIDEPGPETTLSSFIQRLESKKSVWRDRYRRTAFPPPRRGQFYAIPYRQSNSHASGYSNLQNSPYSSQPRAWNQTTTYTQQVPSGPRAMLLAPPNQQLLTYYEQQNVSGSSSNKQPDTSNRGRPVKIRGDMRGGRGPYRGSQPYRQPFRPKVRFDHRLPLLSTKMNLNMNKECSPNNRSNQNRFHHPRMRISIKTTFHR